MKPSQHIRSALVASTMAMAISASAQITGIVSIADPVDGPFATTSQNIDLTATVAPTVTLHVDGHFSVKNSLNGPVVSNNIQINRFYMRTGDIPVLVDNFLFTWDGKLVNATNENATLNGFVNLAFRELDDLDGDGRPDDGESTISFESNFAFLDTQNGNGFKEFNGSGALNSWSRVLAANSTYIFAISPELLATSAAGLDGFTLEFHRPGFDGFTMTFDQQAVPEPATMAVLGLGAAFLARRRRTR